LWKKTCRRLPSCYPTFSKLSHFKELSMLAVKELDVAACIAAAKQGDLQALGPLVQVFLPALKAAARKHVPEPLRNRLLDSDLVQDALLAALGNITRFRGDTEMQFQAWLMNILHHVAHNAVYALLAAKRDREREVAFHDTNPRHDIVSNHEPEPGEAASRQEDQDHLSRAVACLAVFI
jgi:DNA-directed RNA polymerase specialized sigma24 family protein